MKVGDNGLEGGGMADLELPDLSEQLGEVIGLLVLVTGLG